MMKRFLLLLTILAFVVAVPLASIAQDKVNCCMPDGKCAPVAKADCDKAKGTVVKDCKDCKKK